MADEDAASGAAPKTEGTTARRGKSTAAKAGTPKVKAEPADTGAVQGTGAAQGKGAEGTAVSGAGFIKGLRPGLIGLVLGVIVTAGLALAWPGARDRLAALFSGKPPAPVAATAAPDARAIQIARLAKRLDALEAGLSRLGADLATLKSTAPGGVGAAESLESLERRLAAMEARPAAMEARLAAITDGGAALGAIEKRLAGLAKALTALEARMGQAPGGGDMAGSVALMALSGALRGSAPFRALAVPARRVITGSGNAALGARLDALGPYGEKGVPGRVALAARFNVLPRGKAKPSPGTEPGPVPEGLWDRMTAYLRGLVVIRRVDDGGAPVAAAKGGPWAAASRAVAAGDLAAAAAALEGTRRAEVAAWRRDAEARILADGLADDLDALIGERLGRRAQNP